MKPLLLLSVLAALLTGCCCPGERRHRSHHRTTPIPAPPPPVAYVPAPTPIPAPPPVSVNPVMSQPGDIELKTEDVHVAKQTVSNGALRIRKYVTTQNVSIPVTLCRDEFEVQRTPVSGPSNAPFEAAESYYDIPLTREVATPVITPRLLEVLHVKRTTVCETNLVGAVLRTEKAEVIRR